MSASRAHFENERNLNHVIVLEPARTAMFSAPNADSNLQRGLLAYTFGTPSSGNEEGDFFFPVLHTDSFLGTVCSRVCGLFFFLTRCFAITLLYFFSFFFNLFNFVLSRRLVVCTQRPGLSRSMPAGCCVCPVTF